MIAGRKGRREKKRFLSFQITYNAIVKIIADIKSKIKTTYIIYAPSLFSKTMTLPNYFKTPPNESALRPTRQRTSKFIPKMFLLGTAALISFNMLITKQALYKCWYKEHNIFGATDSQSTKQHPFTTYYFFSCLILNVKQTMNGIL
jgi:hypothetical protein